MAGNTDALTEKLGQAHVKLLDALRDLQGTARMRTDSGLSALRVRLEGIRKCLGEHFGFEEQNGYLDVVRQREPFADRVIEKLHAEHQELAQALDDLLGEVRGCESLEAAVRDRVREWIMRVRCHESRESNLIQDAFNLDIGAED